MSPIFSIAANPYAIGALSLAGGYALNKVGIAANQIAAKRFGLPIDFLEGRGYEEHVTYVRQKTEDLKPYIEPMAKFLKTDSEAFWEKCKERIPGFGLCTAVALAIREEYLYRHLLESVILPAIFPQFAAFSLARTFVSSLYFASTHLLNPGSKEALRGQFCNTFVLGVVCSIAKEKFGLVASIFTHVGFNLHAWQWNCNYNFSDTLSKLKVLGPIEGLVVPIFLATAPPIGEIITTFLLAHMAIKKIWEKMPRDAVATSPAFV